MLQSPLPHWRAPLSDPHHSRPPTMHDHSHKSRQSKIFGWAKPLPPPSLPFPSLYLCFISLIIPFAPSLLLEVGPLNTAIGSGTAL